MARHGTRSCYNNHGCRCGECRAATREYHAENREKRLAATLSSKRRKQEQEAGRPRSATCEICGERTTTCFDHDHVTGEFRGWICHRCNRVLGSCKDDPELLYKLAEYVEA